jgi:hypothetical protein
VIEQYPPMTASCSYMIQKNVMYDCMVREPKSQRDNYFYASEPKLLMMLHMKWKFFSRTTRAVYRFIKIRYKKR